MKNLISIKNLMLGVLLATFTNVFSQNCIKIETEMDAVTGSYVMPSVNAKSLRTSARRTGRILLDYSQCNSMPDSLKRALTLACDVWSGYIKEGDVRIGIRYDDTQGPDIKISNYYRESSDIYYPQSLLYLFANKERIYENDAIVQINRNCQWCVGVGPTVSETKNLSYTMLRAITTVLGFGSSVKYNRRKTGLRFATYKGKTVFDKLIFANDGTKMKNLQNDSPSDTSLGNFVREVNGSLYAAKHEDTHKLYSSPYFDEYKSLKYLDNKNSLMHYKPASNMNLLVDNITLELLECIGWKFSETKQIKILGVGIDETGITSAYCSHQFYLDSKSSAVTNHNWTYKLPLSTGGYKTVCTSKKQQFTIPAISDGQKYKHTIEGDIRGKILFTGLNNGSTVNDEYNITLELKPQIISANIISITPCEYDDTYYNAFLEINYEGCHYLHVNVEEENSSTVNTYFSDRPYYTQLKLVNIDSWADAFINIIVRNEYGSGNYQLSIPSSLKSGLSVPISTTDLTLTSNRRVLDNQLIEVYNINGILETKIKNIEDLKSIGSGIYILRILNSDGTVIKTKIYKQ